jgi:SAM-dependent methyltransferase
MTEEFLTGERTWPGVPRENYWFMRHLACYRWAATVIDRQAPSGWILDAGSGEGYGTAELSADCRRDAVGVELDAATAHHARGRYPRVSHVQANLIALPFQSRSIAACVSLQVIEHIWDPVTYLRELARCTAGPVIISTPNRPVHSPGLARGKRPENPFHVREFDALELVELLATADSGRTPVLYGVRHGQRLRAWENESRSLPQALIEEPDASDVAAVAGTVAVDDFTIEVIEIDTINIDTIDIDTINVDEAGLDVHDLVAVW